MENTYETDVLIKGACWGLLVGAFMLPVSAQILENFGLRTVLSIVLVAILLASLILLLPVAVKLMRRGSWVSIDDTVAIMRARIIGRFVGILLGMALGSPLVMLMS